MTSLRSSGTSEAILDDVLPVFADEDVRGTTARRLVLPAGVTGEAGRP